MGEGTSSKKAIRQPFGDGVANGLTTSLYRTMAAARLGAVLPPRRDALRETLFKNPSVSSKQL